MKLDDVLSYGPYAGETVGYVLKHDPAELLEHDKLIPKYILDPNVTRAAHHAVQDLQGWAAFMRLWRNV